MQPASPASGTNVRDDACGQRPRRSSDRACHLVARSLSTLLGLSALASSAASCSSSADRPAFTDGTKTSGGSTDAGNGSNDGTGSLGPGDDAGVETGDDCSEAAKLVYVVSAENTLYSFAPDTLTFAPVGPLDCPAGDATPNSMAVDRSGTAWVNFSDGSLFAVSTKDASCKATPFEPNQHGFTRFGMAFASNSAGSTDETLYVVGIDGLDDGKGLAKIDLQTFALTPLGDFSGDLAGMGAELTGTGEGKLYGFFTTFPDATLAEITKGNGKTTGALDLDGVSTGSAWAFSFWGGDFWFYTSPGGTPSSVTRLAASGNNRIEVVMDTVGSVGRIVGAGVSTCAPTRPPS